MTTSFLSRSELNELGFKKLGKNVLISRNANFYNSAAIEIGNNVRIDDFCILSGNIKIGSYVHIAPFCGLYGGGGIELNDFSGLSSRVSLYSVTDNYLGEALTGPCIPDDYRIVETGKIVLEKHALVGASSVILPNTILSEGTTLGALSLGKGNLKAWSIYAGSPAKLIKERHKATILALEDKLLKKSL